MDTAIWDLAAKQLSCFPSAVSVQHNEPHSEVQDRSSLVTPTETSQTPIGYSNLH